MTYSDKKKLIDAIEHIANIITSTMGPTGHNVVVNTTYGAPFIKDGAYIAAQLQAAYAESDIYMRVATKSIADISRAAVKISGDGTTLTTLLFAEMCKAMKNLKCTSVFDVKNGMEMAVHFIGESLRDQSRSILDERGNIDAQLLCHVATISANNDTNLGMIISELVHETGKDGIVFVENSNSEATTTERKSGYLFDTGFVSPKFANNSSGFCIMEAPFVCLVNEVIQDEEELFQIFDHYEVCCAADNRKRPLVIIAQDIVGDALASAIKGLPQYNRDPNIKSIPVVVITAPSGGQRRVNYMDDIAVFTGTDRVYSKTAGLKLTDFGKDVTKEFGVAQRVIVNGRQTVIELDPVNQDTIDDRIEHLKQGLGKSKHSMQDSEIGDYRERIAKLSSGIGIIYVGAPTDGEQAYKKALVEDAQLACYTAIRKGVVPGGGKALLNAWKHLSGVHTLGKDEDKGFEVVMDAIKTHIETVLKSTPSRQLKRKIKELIRMPYDSEGVWMGVDGKSGEVCDLFEEGILDPLDVVLTALQKAVSGASSVFTTQHIVDCMPRVQADSALMSPRGFSNA